MESPEISPSLLKVVSAILTPELYPPSLVSGIRPKISIQFSLTPH